VTQVTITVSQIRLNSPSVRIPTVYSNMQKHHFIKTKIIDNWIYRLLLSQFKNLQWVHLYEYYNWEFLAVQRKCGGGWESSLSLDDSICSCMPNYDKSLPLPALTCQLSPSPRSTFTLTFSFETNLVRGNKRAQMK